MTTLEKRVARPAEETRQRPFHLKVASALRWLHIYISMLMLMLVLFFSATGLTLNHPEWFSEGKTRRTELTGKVSTDWLAPGVQDETKVARLEVVEYLRKAHNLRGAVDEFRVDETECMISLKSAGYSADCFINRETGAYQLTTLEEGAIAVMNDLHKGRHSGKAWSGVIDFSAIFLVIISLTGMGLMFFLKRLRTAGLLTALAGFILVLLIARFLVP